MLNSDLLGLISHPNVTHLNMVLMLGIVIFAGTVGAKFFQWLKIPQIVGYIIIGLAIGESGLKIVSSDTVTRLAPMNFFALGIIGFMIGGELKKELFQKYGKQFMAILLAEGITAFILVGIASTILSYLFTHNIKLSVALGVVLGAIASATDPASTIQVFWEYKTRGPLTSSTVAVVALDDALALTLYGLGTSVAGILTGREGSGSVVMSVLHAFMEMGFAIALGVVAALILNLIIKKTNDKDNILVFAISSVMLVIGLATALHIDIILASMALGMTLTNITPRKTVDTFDMVKAFAPPIYVLFFVFAGARISVANLAPLSWYLVGAYVLFRSLGKMTGAFFGARISKAPASVQKYLGFCLFAQGGVAVGLSIVASEKFDASISHIVIAVVAATTLVVQLLGPPFVKFGAKKAREIGLNITEEDLLKTYKVKDIMDSVPATIKHNLPLEDIFTAFSENDTLYYPVVDDNNDLLGAITIESIRECLANQKAAPWLLAYDVMVPDVDKVSDTDTLESVVEKMKNYNLEHVCVTDEDNRLVGILDARAIHRKINAEVLRRQRQADSETTPIPNPA